MKVMFLGDSHTDILAIKNAHDAAETTGIDVIFQLGDFGYYPRATNGVSYLNWIHKNVTIPLYWMPGNHEDWPEYLKLIWNSEKDDDGFAIAGTGSMRVAPHVHSWTWDGLSFGLLGGAYSVNRSVMKEGWEWFHEEVPEYASVDELPDKVDILLTHDAVDNLAKYSGWGPLPDNWVVDWKLSNQSQGVMKAAAIKTQPKVSFHGHWHYKIAYKVEGLDTQFYGLNESSNNMALQTCAMVLDTETRSVFNWNDYIYEGEPVWQAS